MTDYLGIEVGIAVAFVLIVIILFRMAYIVQPGQVGLVFVLGSYMRTMEPGFVLVTVIGRMRKVTPGTGPNGSLAMLGTSEADIGPDLPFGSVRIGDRVVQARGATRIPSGSKVRVIEDSDSSGVLVALERFAAPPVRAA
jgi:membrane-bound ClpP family serine protease